MEREELQRLVEEEHEEANKRKLERSRDGEHNLTLASLQKVQLFLQLSGYVTLQCEHGNQRLVFVDFDLIVPISA